MSQTTFKQSLDARLRTGFARVGMADAATFTPDGGSPVTCTVIVRRGVTLQGDTSQVVNDAVSIECYRDQIGIPSSGDVFTIGAESFFVDRVDSKDENRVICIVSPE